jgi:hypothetical protein
MMLFFRNAEQPHKRLPAGMGCSCERGRVIPPAFLYNGLAMQDPIKGSNCEYVYGLIIPEKQTICTKIANIS